MVAAKVRVGAVRPADARGQAAHENLDGSFMIILFRGVPPARKIGRGGAPPGRRSDRRRMTIMKWETPEAVDFRFGMEITMYVANR